jgi:dodecin
MRRSRGASHAGSEEAAHQVAATARAGIHHEEGVMSTYKVIEVIGTSTTSWEDAATQAVKIAGETLHDLRVAEVTRQDIHVGEGGEIIFRTKLELSFKYEHEHEH